MISRRIRKLRRPSCSGHSNTPSDMTSPPINARSSSPSRSTTSPSTCSPSAGTRPGERSTRPCTTRGASSDRGSSLGGSGAGPTRKPRRPDAINQASRHLRPQAWLLPPASARRLEQKVPVHCGGMPVARMHATSSAGRAGGAERQSRYTPSPRPGYRRWGRTRALTARLEGEPIPIAQMGSSPCPASGLSPIGRSVLGCDVGTATN